MQLVLAICVRCEKHGPRVLMVTQPGRDVDFSDEVKQISSRKAECTVAEWKANAVNDEPRCPTCSAFTDGLGYSTWDTLPGINYISSEVAMNARVNRLTQEACVASFYNCNKESASVTPSTPSCSAGEGNSEAVVYGNDQRGFALAKLFWLRDAKACEKQRCFSFIAVSIDKYLLINNYKYLNTAMSYVIKELKKQSEIVYTQEKYRTSLIRRRPRVHFVLGHSSSSEKIRNLKPGNSRSLQSLTNNPEVFDQLHKYFIIMIRGVTQVTTEVVLEGNPSQDVYAREEFDAEEQAEVRMEGTGCQQDALLRCFARVRQIAKKIKQQEDAINDCLLKGFLEHVLCGKKVVVKSDDEAFTKRFLSALTVLLPVKCAHYRYQKAYDAEEIYNLFGCPTSVEVPSTVNDAFIIRLDVEKEVFDFDMVGQKSVQDAIDKNTGEYMIPGSSTNIAADIEYEYSKCLLHVEALPSSLAKEFSTLAERYYELLLDDEIPNGALKATIEESREYWLNKAKLLFQLQSKNPNIDTGKLISIMNLGKNDYPMLINFEEGISESHKEFVTREVEKALDAKQKKQDSFRPDMW